MAHSEWTDATHVRRYPERAEEFPHRAEGESVLLEQLPEGARRVVAFDRLRLRDRGR